MNDLCSLHMAKTEAKYAEQHCAKNRTKRPGAAEPLSVKACGRCPHLVIAVVLHGLTYRSSQGRPPHDPAFLPDLLFAAAA